MTERITTERMRRFWIREPFCGFSHGIGAALSVVALVVLLILAHGKVWQTVSFAVFGVSLIVLYTASTLYHSLWVKPQQILKLMRFDHVAIFLLIAGTYAPVCLVGLRGVWGWSLFGIEYGLAVIGIVCSLVWKGFPDWARIGIYVIMGWLIMIAIVPAAHVLGPAGIAWLFGGGAAYSIGTVVFATDRPHLWPGKFSAHDLWHIFVLAGSACHFILMAVVLAPMM